VEQSVGRIQRKQVLKDTDNVPTVIDVVDDYSVFAKQYVRRTAFYRKQKYQLDEDT
jgi:hypothetical protein